MKRKTLQKSFAAAMTAALLLNVCTGCSLGGSKGATLEVSLEHSYSSEPLQIEGIERLSSIYAVGDKMIVAGYNNDYSEDSYAVYNVTDNSTQPFSFAYSESLPEDTEASPIAVIATDDGGMKVLYSSYSFANDEYKDLGMILETYDSNFQVVDTKKIDSVDGSEGFNNIVPDPDGGYFATMYDESGNPSLGVLDENFKKVKNVNVNSTYISGVVTAKDGTCYVAYQDMEYNNVVGKIDAEAGSVSTLTIEGMPSWYNECIPSTDEKYDFYITQSNSLYGVNAANGTCEEVINWINSDFTGDFVTNITQLLDGRFCIVSNSMDYTDSSMWLLSPRSEEELKDLELISMAVLYPDGNLINAVSNFNRTNDKYRIVVYDYSKFNTDEDYEAGLNKFESDMTSGIVADMISLNGLPYESLCNKGIFTDLDEFSENLTDDKYFTNYFDSLRYGDKLYRLSFAFSVQTLLAKTEHVGEGTMDIKAFTELLKNMPEGMKPMSGDITRDSIVNMFITSNLNSFVDVNSATCSFNSQEFIDLLEFSNTLPAESGMNYENMEDSDWNSYWEDEGVAYLDDKALFYNEYISDLQSSYRDQMTYFDQEPVTMCGFPIVNENDNGGRFESSFSLAISSNSKCKDVCWSFFEYMLSDDFQNQLTWYIPVSKSAFDAKAQEAMSPDTYIDENGNEQVMDFTVYRGNTEVKVPEMTQEYVDKIKNYIEGVTVSSYYDEQLYTIVDEEVQKYFAGDQDAKQTSDVIQSRASLYLAEQH